MRHKLESFNVRDIPKNAINAAIAAFVYTQTKEQVVERTEHTPDDITVRVSATAAGSAASLATRKYTDAYVDKIADWIVTRRRTPKPDPIIPEVPTQS